MKKLNLLAMAIVLSFAVFHSCNLPLTDEPSGDELSLKSANQAGAKSYIVVLNEAVLNAELATQTGYEQKQKAAKSAAERILKRAGITDGEIGFVYGTAIKGFSVMIPPGQLKKLQDDPSVKLIEEDQIVTLIEPNARPTGKPGGGTTPPPAQSIPWGITRVGGGSTYNGSNVAWIIDTGVDYAHPDLNVDEGRAATFVNRTSTANDDNGHGTHCAGIIAAIDNEVGVIGVAAGATVVPVKVLDKRGSGFTSGVIAGVDYVAAKAVSNDVANMSLGGGVSTTLDAAVLAASSSCKFALAAGNEGDDANNHSPARVNGSNIYTISAMDSNDKMPSWSNWGNPPVDFCEPGVSIYSTYKGGGYATLSGTSMAAPHAAGLLLLGSIRNGGTVEGDPDGKPDVIGIH